MAKKKKNALRKRMWRRITAHGYLSQDPCVHDDMMLTQADFLKEYYPSGHRIHSKEFYPNIFRKAVFELPDGSVSERFYEEQVPRIAFAIQKLIATKHLVHVVGNDVQFDVSKSDISEEERDTISKFHHGWSMKDMEVAVYNMVKSYLVTADAAFVGNKNGGEFSWQTFSFLNGDTLYPHYASDGTLELFVRRFSYVDDEGMVGNYCEVWDKQRHYVLKNAKNADGDSIVIAGYDFDGYDVTEVNLHGYNYVPVAYARNEEGPCWSDVNDLVCEYEESFSQMAQNNKAFGEPILLFKGNDISCVPDDLSGTIKTIDMDKESEVKYLEAQSASDSFMKQMESVYKMIFETGFAVQPPELKSGDLPAAALKILYSPAYEKAICDAAELSPLLNDIVRIFRDGYGAEVGDTIGFSNLPITPWIKPYVHVNWSSVVADITACVDRGILSKKTASERIQEYAMPDEYARIIEEQQEQAITDIETELFKSKRLAEENNTE